MTTRIHSQAELLAQSSRRARPGVLRVELNVPGYSRDVRRLQHQFTLSLPERNRVAMASILLLAALVTLAGFAH
jgi:hypothetical protein